MTDRMTAVAKLPTVDELAQEIRRVDGNHSLGAGALAEALMPFLAALSPAELGGVAAVAWRFLDEDGKPTSKWADMDAKPMHYRDGMLTPGAYPGTSIQYAYTTPRAAEAVSDEMVERGVVAYMEHDDYGITRDIIRAIIAASLTPPSAKGE